MIEAFANTPFSYTYNVGLDGTQAWTAQTVVVTLDYTDIVVANVNISQITSALGQPNTNLPNPNNFALTISANAAQMTGFMSESLNPNERVLLLQTMFTSNTGNQVHANNITFRIKNSLI